jgi:hypothetical protein
MGRMSERPYRITVTRGAHPDAAQQRLTGDIRGLEPVGRYVVPQPGSRLAVLVDRHVLEGFPHRPPSPALSPRHLGEHRGSTVSATTIATASRRVFTAGPQPGAPGAGP